MSIKEKKEITKTLVKVEVVILVMIFTIILLHTMPLAGTAMFVVDCISIEISKLNTEYELKRDAREIDTNLKVQQMKADAKDRKIKYAISIGETVVSTAVIIWGTLKSFKFEENGTITTIMGRGFINKLLPKK